MQMKRDYPWFETISIDPVTHSKIAQVSLTKLAFSDMSLGFRVSRILSSPRARLINSTREYQRPSSIWIARFTRHFEKWHPHCAKWPLFHLALRRMHAILGRCSYYVFPSHNARTDVASWEKLKLGISPPAIWVYSPLKANILNERSV